MSQVPLAHVRLEIIESTDWKIKTALITNEARQRVNIEKLIKLVSIFERGPENY